MGNRDLDQVLVAGAGPTGLLLAGQLARVGVRVRIVDSRAGGCAESRALGIHARTLEMLDDLGLAEQFLACGHRVRGFCLWDGTRRLARIDFGVLDSAFPFLLDIPQDETERILRGHLDSVGVRVEQSTELVDLTPAVADVEAILRRPDGTRELTRVPYLVGCDGAHSTVRRRLGMPFPGDGYSQEWLLADVAVDWDRSPDEVHIVFNPAGRAAVFMPMRDRRWRVILYFAGERRTAGSPPTLEEIAELVSQRVPGRVTVTDPSWLASFRTHRRSAPAYRSGRVFLAGDAVHIHSPAGGQGLNTGLLDAENLAWKLAAVLTADAPDSLLDSYQAERGPVAAEVLDLSHRLVRLSSLSAPWQRMVRAAAVPLVAHRPGFRARAARRISQLYVHYRTSPLIEPVSHPAAHGPQPGDRAPDAHGLSAGGEPTTLHRLLRGAQHTLLLLSPHHEQETRRRLARYAPQVRPLQIVADNTATSIDDVDAAIDLDGQLHRRYRPAGTVHLIRPDGYLAASGADAIESYLTRVYGPRAPATPTVSAGTSTRRRAVVIGASMAGLLTAVALREHFAEVTIIERDRLPAGPQVRRGTPHGRHLHTCWMAGLAAVERMLPGFQADLIDAGAQPIRLPTDLRWLTPAGVWVHRFDETARLLSASRAVLEWTVRRRVEQLDRITIVANHEVTGLRTDSAGHITGATARSRGNDELELELAADLVVDATGRGSRLPAWLGALGRTLPRESIVDGYLGYATRYFAIPPDDRRDWTALYVQAAPPDHTRGGLVFPIEGDRWVVTLVGGGRDYPPTDEAGFLDFAASLRSRELFDAIAHAEPVSPIWGYRRTANHRRHYEHLRDLPGRLLAVGDSLCAFNPVYGQGMTVAALQAQTLNRLLDKQSGDLTRFTRNAQRALSTVADDAWLVSTGEDLRYPTTIGARVTTATTISHRYMDRVIRAVAHDPHVNAAFLRVLNMIDRPTALFRPTTMIRTLLAARHEPRGSNPTPDPRPLTGATAQPDQ